jgi:hypothetical protein
MENCTYSCIHIEVNMGKQICNKCDKEKDISEFDFRTDTKKYRKTCKECHKQVANIYRLNNKDEIKKRNHEYDQNHKIEKSRSRKKRHEENKEYENSQSKKYREEHLEEMIIYAKQYREDHKREMSSYQKEYAKSNKDKIRVRKNQESKNRKKNDPAFRLRSIVSTKIATTLKDNSSSKNGKSSTDYLDYSIQELKEHLEAQFEPWMSWVNYGKYISKIWNDNDSSTWVWNIDHIVPQFDLPYTSMADDNFKKCWSLENLRPYSAKQNQLDGITKIRHKKDIL